MLLVSVCLVLLFHHHGQLHPSKARLASKTTQDSLQGVQGENAGDHGRIHDVKGSRSADQHVGRSQKEKDAEDMVVRDGENDVGIVDATSIRMLDGSAVDWELAIASLPGLAALGLSLQANQASGLLPLPACAHAAPCCPTLFVPSLASKR